MPLLRADRLASGLTSASGGHRVAAVDAQHHHTADQRCRGGHRPRPAETVAVGDHTEGDGPDERTGEASGLNYSARVRGCVEVVADDRELEQPGPAHPAVNATMVKTA